MANFFTRAFDKITPWNRPGEVQRNQQAQAKKKKKEDLNQINDPGGLSINAAKPDQQKIQAQRPENLFAGLNANLTLPNAPNTNVQVNKPAQPQKGPGFWNKVGGGLKTAGQTAVGTVANIPEVGLAAARAGTGIVQGAAHLPSLATHALTYVPRRVAGDNSSVNRVLSSVNRGVDTATSVVDRPFGVINSGLDRAAQSYAAHVPMAAGGAQVYKTEQIPLNVLAGLLTLGGSTAAEAGNVGKVGQVSRFFNRPLISNPNNLIARTGQVVNRGAPVARGVMTPIRTARSGIQSGLGRFRNTRVVPTTGTDAVAAAEAGNVVTEVGSVTKIPVGTGIDVNAPTSQPVNVPVTVNPRPIGQPIREISGDAPVLGTNKDIARNAAIYRGVNARNVNSATRPDTRIEGVTPGEPAQPFKLTDTAVKTGQDKAIDSYAALLKDVGEGNGVAINRATNTRASNNYRPGNIGSKRMTKADWRDEAERQLKAGQAESGHQKAFNDAANPEVQSMIAKGEQPTAPEGRPITVKQANGIPVVDQTVVPTGLPEVPGTVRATAQTSPMAAKSEAAANAPVVASPASLPAETQAILDNPKQYSKRQVAAARNQRKLAKQLAKTKAETQAVIDNSPQLAPKSESSTPGFAPTGEFKRGVNNNVSEVAHQSTEAAQAATDTASLSSGDVLAKANQEIAQGGRVSPESVRNLQAMLESGRFPHTSPEYRAMAKTLYGGGSDYGRGLSLFNPTMRRTASGDQLTNRFVSKLYGVTEDTSKVTDSHIAAVTQAENNFTTARDAADQALDRYNATKSAADFTAWKQARQAADDAEKQALITEYKVTNEVLKGNKDPVALKAIQQAEQKSGVYQMDWIDSSMLSGTGTMTRNLVNTSLVRAENRLFGGRGYSSKGAKLGGRIGNRSIVTDYKARNELDQNKLSKAVKQWTTTGNTLGEGNINAVGSARAYKYYENQLKAKGITGDQLKRDTEVMLHTDPDGMAKHYEQWSLTENALSGLTHSKKIEQMMVDAIASKGGGKLSQTAAKALVRLTVGFPTVIGRSLVGGVKRGTFGAPDLISAGKAFAKGDTQAMKDALYSAKVHAGSGAALYALGAGLAQSGHISPSYPTDPAEQARWKAEGIQPNSIKIGGSWFGIPGYFGALALPLIIPANIMNKNNPADIIKGVVSGLQDLAPTTGLINFIDGIEGRGGKQWVKNEISSLTRAVTPVGSLLNQISRMTDPTKNDTTTKDAIGNILDSIAAGIPGLNNAVNKIPATDASGNVLHNPNPAATFFGAQGAEQPKGVQDVQQAQSTANDTYKQLSDYGVLTDKTLMGLVDKKLQAQIARGQDLTPEQVDSVRKAIVKGVSATGEDTAYLEKGQYDTNLAALKVKHDLLAADPTTKPSSLKDLETAITRGGLYKDNQIPYDMIKSYQGTGIAEWRAMGDPENDNYDPGMYQQLWDIDQLMTKAGVSYKKGALDKNKYYAKEKKAGGAGSRSGSSYSSSFGTLKSGNFAPSVQQYQTMGQQSGSIPIIHTVRPNIVHKIGSSG